MIEIRQEIKLNNIYWIDMLKYSKNNDETRDNPVYHMYDKYVFVWCIIGVITYFFNNILYSSVSKDISVNWCQPVCIIFS